MTEKLPEQKKQKKEVREYRGHLIEVESVEVLALTDLNHEDSYEIKTESGSRYTISWKESQKRFGMYSEKLGDDGVDLLTEKNSQPSPELAVVDKPLRLVFVDTKDNVRLLTSTPVISIDIWHGKVAIIAEEAKKLARKYKELREKGFTEDDKEDGGEYIN